MKSSMELKDIEYFLEIVDQGSFSKASKRLNISQPALSQSIRKLEKEFDCKLLDRSTRQLNLTVDGEFLYNKGKQIIHDLYDIEQHMKKNSESEKEILRIGISPFYSKYYVPSLLPILNSYQNLCYEIIEDISMNLENKLIEGQVDLCFLPRMPKNPSFEYRTICIEEILLAVPAEYDINTKAIGGKDLSYLELSELRTLPFVSLKKEQKIRPLIDEVCHSAGFSPNIVYETLDWDTVNIMITNGIGVGFIPDILMSKSKEEKRHPCFYRIANRSIRREYAAAWLKNRILPPATEEIIYRFRSEIIRMH